jgi:hypothetical protein
MSFDDYRRTVEITSDPQIVEQWKEEARKSVTFHTKNEENPATFESLTAVEQHFRLHYLPSLIRPCLAAELSGDTARHLPDRGIIAAIRKARERENRFPAQIAGSLRHGLNQAGLHVFKHKKRILYISTVRPQPFDPNQASVSSSLSAILSTIRSYPKISRKQLAEKVLSKFGGESASGEASAENQHAKTVLATDLIWLAKAGHVIEFADGTLDLPLPPKPVESEKAVVSDSHPDDHDALKVAETPGTDQNSSSTAKCEDVSEEDVGETTVEPQDKIAVATDPGTFSDPFEQSKSSGAAGEVSEAAGDFPDEHGDVMGVSSQPNELQSEKTEDADCAPAGSASRAD